MDTESIKKHMVKLLSEGQCIDKRTGEVNYTELAETTADHLDLYVDDVDFEIPEEVFDLAVEAGEDF